jgi:signal transduction histidine kinase
LTKIKKEGVKMRPKFYFIAKAILLALAFLATTLFVLYIISFVVFSLRTSGVWFLPMFGFSGIKIFWLALPWIPILIAGLAIILLELLAKRFNLIYRRPILYSLIAILTVAVMGGFLLEKAPFHSEIFIKSQNDRLPGIGGFYREFGASQPKNARFGVVLSVQENAFVIRAPNNQTTTIIITDNTKIKPGYKVKEKDKISVLGKFTNGKFEAIEVREIKGNFKFFNPPSSRNLNR